MIEEEEIDDRLYTIDEVGIFMADLQQRIREFPEDVEEDFPETIAKTLDIIASLASQIRINRETIARMERMLLAVEGLKEAADKLEKFPIHALY